jgi:hypothetical protein
MATVAWPNTAAFVPSALEVQLRPQVRLAESIYTGQVTSFETPFSAWWLTVTLTSQSPADRAAVEAFLHTVRGPANRVTMWHHMRPVPRGTQQANTTTAAGAALGASSASINLSGSLLAGDMISIALTAGGTALVQVTADQTSTGAQTVQFAPQLRGAVSNGAVVTVIRPTALFILRDAPTIGYVPGEATPITLQFSEVFA